MTFFAHRTLLTILALVLNPLPARADVGADLRLRVVAAVGEAQLERWLKQPEYVVQNVASIAHGYDPGQALTATAIETAILHDRAKARARAMRDLYDADLDADGTIDRSEVGRIALSLSGRARGLLWLRHRRADADADGRVTPVELRSYAERRAVERLSSRAAQDKRDLLALDIDGDGGVKPEEAERALTMLAKAAQLSAARAGVIKEDI